MKEPKYIIYDPEGDDYTYFKDEAYRYTNGELIKYFERWYPVWLPKGVRIIQTYEREEP